MKPFFQKHPLLFAHRGCSIEYPENTFPAFQHAVNLGIDVLEIDVRLTADEQLVVFHDSQLGRVSNGAGDVLNLTLGQLKEINAGYNFSPDGKTFPYREQKLEIPELGHLFQLFPGIRFNIDIKDKNKRAVRKLWKIICESGMQEKVVVGSFHSENILNFRKLSSSTVATSASQSEVVKFYFFRFFRRLVKFRFDFDALQIPVRFSVFKLATSSLLKFAHQAGLVVHYWTVNDPVEMQQLLKLGADGIMTDNPQLVMEQYKLWKKAQEINLTF